jgi:hypothetical protein
MKHHSRVTAPLVALLTTLVIILAGCNRDVGVSINGDALSITVSESAINSAWRVTASRLRVDNLAIDLQPNQVAIKGTLTPLRGGAYSAQLNIAPTVSNGTVNWNAVSASVNNVAANSEQLGEISTAFLDSWANYVKSHYGAQRVTAVTITDTDITYTLGK